MQYKETETRIRKALIFNVQKYNMYDGPGVRTLIFFKGCPLRCAWCSNPEGLMGGYQVLFRSSVCVGCWACTAVCPVSIHRSNPDGGHEIDRTKTCVGCKKCEEICPVSALSIAGEYRTIADLMDIVLEDKSFYDFSGGGVTLGGGEVTLQPEAAVSLLMACKQQGIHTAIETCGYVRSETLFRFAEYTDLFLFDVKHFDPEEHVRYTGVRNEGILSNLVELLRKRQDVKVRIPLLRGINDDAQTIDGICALLEPFVGQKNFKGIDLLPYHKLGVNKYHQVDMEYKLQGDRTMSEDDLARVERQIAGRGIDVTTIRH